MKTYRNNIIYKVNDDYLEGECAACGEDIEEGLVATLGKTQKRDNEYVIIKLSKL